MGKKYLYLFLVVSLFFLNRNSCSKRNVCEDIIIINNSYLRIYYELYWNYPDTTIGEYNPVSGKTPILPGDTFIRGLGRPHKSDKSCAEEIFENKPKENIYFFDADTVENIPWEVVRTTYRGVLARKEFDLEYLKNNNFTITYP